jgi:hypothetical protein
VVGHGFVETSEAVLGRLDRPHFGRHAEAHTSRRPARPSRDVSDTTGVLRPAPDIDGNALLAAAVDDPVRLDAVAVGPGVFPPRLGAGQDADPATVQHVVVADHVAGLVVAERDVVIAIAVDPVPLGQFVLDTPAPEQADPIALRPVAANQGTLRPGAGGMRRSALSWQ